MFFWVVTQNGAYLTCTFHGCGEMIQFVLLFTLNSISLIFYPTDRTLNPKIHNRHPKNPLLSKNQQGHCKSIWLLKTTNFSAVTPNCIDYGYYFFFPLISDRLNKDLRSKTKKKKNSWLIILTVFRHQRVLAYTLRLSVHVHACHPHRGWTANSLFEMFGCLCCLLESQTEKINKVLHFSAVTTLIIFKVDWWQRYIVYFTLFFLS